MALLADVHGVHKEVRAALCASLCATLSAAAPCLTNAIEQFRGPELAAEQSTDDLERIASLHPLVQTLVLAVSDIYAHRLAETRLLHEAELSVLQKTTQGIAQHAREVAHAVRSTSAECRARILADTESAFFQKHRAELQHVQWKRGELEQALLAQCGGNVEAIRTSLPMRSLPPLPEPLPWAKLEARMAEWQEQRRRARHVLSATQARISGLQLSSLLERPRAAVSPSAASPSAGWTHMLAATRAATTTAWSSAGSTPAWLFARFRTEKAMGAESADLIEQHLEQRALHSLTEFQKHATESEQRACAELAQRRAHLAKSTAVGEGALQRELRAATAGNEYTWRAVQRAVQAIFLSYESGMHNAAQKLNAQHVGALADLLRV